MIERICRVSGNKFQIEKEDLEFYAKMGVITDEQLNKLTSIQVEDSTSVEAEKIPAELLIGLPTLCPEERCRKRMILINMTKLYKRKCDATGKNIISIYDQSSDLSVYEQDYWWSDEWNALDYGQEFCFSQSFFDQVKILNYSVPMPNLLTLPSVDENSKYTNYALRNKNCYLIFHANDNQDCLYSFGIKHSIDVIDTINCFSSELIYESIDCENCYEMFYCYNCENCSNSYFLESCIGCKNCIFCKNLRQKEYYVFNKKVSKSDFEKIEKELKNNAKYLLKIKKEFRKFKNSQPNKFLTGFQNENCSGDQIFRCKNVRKSFDMRDTEDAKFCSRIFNGKNSDCYDVDFFGVNIEQIYESIVIGINAVNIMFSHSCRDQVSNLEYCLYCHFCTDCFGCVGLKNKKYCILNKQYSKEEYFELKEKIIAHMKRTGEWGEFFPTELSPFAYNETVAQEYFPLTKEAAEKRGYKWKEEDTKNCQPQTYKIPEDIKNVPDSICTEILACERTGKNYQIQKAELKFYRKMNLPIPRLHPNERHKDRMKLRNPRKLWKRNCGNCNKEIQTTFAPERPEKILCEECYLKIVD